MRDDYLGYVLNAIGDDERERIARKATTDSAVAERLVVLRRALEPLASDTEDFHPPAGLASRTCALIERRAQETLVEPARESAGGHSIGGGRSHGAWRLVDAVVAMGLVAALALLFFPALMHSRNMANLQACQKNLGQIHAGLMRHANVHGDLFPVVPEKGNEAAAGMYAVRLLHDGFLDQRDPNVFLCASSPWGPKNESFRVPTRQELAQASGDRLRELQRTMGGSYGYTLGHYVGDKYTPTRNRARGRFVLMADAFDQDRNADATSGCSSNHGGSGQNVLFEDGRVLYLTTSRIDGASEDFFRNDRNSISAGLHVDDSVVVHSGVGPAK
jgi:hypothetical protein